MPPLIEKYPLPVLDAPSPRAWRSVESLEEQASGEPAEGEFPKGATEPPRGIARRELLQLVGGAIATVGLSACFQRPSEKVMEYTVRPPDEVPGLPLHYATAFALGGYGHGLVGTDWVGHPTKLDGNALQPSSLGASTPFDQALLLQLYDATRAKKLTRTGDPASFKQYQEEQITQARALEADGGASLRFLLEPSASPLIGVMRTRIAARYPKAKFYSYHAVSRENVYDGAKLAFGQPVETLFEPKGVRVVVSLDADFLGRGPSWLRESRAFIASRQPGPTMSRLYAVEPELTVTGMFADHRLPLRPSEIAGFGRRLLGALAKRRGGPLSRFANPPEAPISEEASRWAEVLAEDLDRAGEHGVVLAGLRQPPEVHALAHLINSALGSAGVHLDYRAPTVHDLKDGPGALAELVGEIHAGKVQTLVITAFNPVYTAPSDIELASALRKVPNAIYWGLHQDETASACTWFCPAAQVLESWGDARAQDGTASLIQPLLAPLWQGLTDCDVLSPFADVPSQTTHQLLQAYWRAAQPVPDFERAWEKWLADGVVPDTVSARLHPRVDPDAVDRAMREGARKESGPKPPTAGPPALEISFAADYTVYDGRFDQNEWLQELPDPVTKLTWGNAAMLSPLTARRLGLKTNDVVEVHFGDQRVELPTFVMPGHADDTVTVPLGYGRFGPRPLRDTVLGGSASSLRRTDAFWHGAGATLVRTGEVERLATTQDHWDLHGRAIAIQRDLKAFDDEGARFLASEKGPVDSLYQPFNQRTEPHRWAMSIDLNRCIGCASCVVACQVENNVPIVGRENTRRGREMHWLRIDRYFLGTPERPEAITQPMACQHCEMAPCEYVCPVNATIHSPEGLNEMVYNRCVGTRFCSNNCPYKVRRFNWLDFHARLPEVRTLVHNPQVTIREQGVMEKCTYCVQRIERARITARMARRPIDTEHLTTACQDACPTEAIVFGSLTEENSPTARAHLDPRHYAVLRDVGTKPRTTYLARIKNPNPEL